MEYLLENSKKKLDIASKGKDIAGRLFFGFAGIVIFLAIWTGIGHLVFTRPGYEQFEGFLPLPTLKAFFALLYDADFWSSVSASLLRVGVGISIAFVFGLPFGLIIGFYKILRIITYPPLQFLRMVSPLSWMPIALLVFATFDSAIYFLISMSTVWPIILNTTLGVSRVNPQWINMARNQGASNQQLIRQIIIPSSIPHILVSLRLALGVAWIVLVPAEFLGVTSGLGYMINDARDTMEYDRLMAILVAIGFIGFFLDGMIKWVQTMFSRTWNY